MIGIARLPAGSAVWRPLLPIGLGITIVLGPYFVVERGAVSAWLGAGGATLGVVVAAILFTRLRPVREHHFGEAGRWWLEAVLAGGASLGGLAVYFARE
jgi:hypothetical protein